MPIPENNTIITAEQIPEDIKQRIADVKIAQLDATINNPVDAVAREINTDNEHKLLIAQLSEDNSNKELLGLATDEQRVLKFIKLHNPNDRFFINWNNIFTLGELYYSNYTSDEYRTYLNRLKLLTSKYNNPKKYYLKFTNKQISAYAQSTNTNTNPIDTINKPIFKNALTEIKNGYYEISQKRIRLENIYKYLSNQAYIEITDKKKFVKLRNKFIKDINAYYVYMYYFNRINNFVMTEKEITLSEINLSYSEITNEMLPKIDKVNVRISDEIINQKYNNESAKLELYLAIKQKLQELGKNTKDKKLDAEVKTLMKEYLEFDKLYQLKLTNYINHRKSKKIISDLVILDDQPFPGDGAVVNPNEGLDDMPPPSTTNISDVGSRPRQSGGNNFDDMDEKERHRKFFFINKARRARGDF